MTIITVYCPGCMSEHQADANWAQSFNFREWRMFVGSGTGIWVSIEQQELYLIEDGQVIRRYRCSTAEAGAGCKEGSGKTPLGWHRIGAKIGDSLAAGAVLKDRIWTGDVWANGQASQEDLMLSRILWLEGLEPGRNRGDHVDSWERYIYIHGTNRIGELGQPASAGCIRLDPHDVIDLYNRVDEGDYILITKE